MIAKTFTYVDFNGTERTEVDYFHLSKQEIIDWETEVDGGMTTIMKRVVDAKQDSEIMKIFKDLIDRAYGVKSDDGRFFRKTPEALADFKFSPKYEQLYVELLQNTDAAINFVKGILPKDMPGALEVKSN